MERQPISVDDQEPLRAWNVGAYLDRLAARRPTPAGGAAAAFALAQAAALLTMVARIEAGSVEAAEVLERAQEIQERALDLAEEDMRVFDAVTEAAALPRGTEGRAAAIAAALVAAAGPPAEVVVLGGEVVTLAEHLAAVTRSAVVADVAAAAELATAAIAISRTNAESDLHGATNSGEVTRLRALLAPVDGVLARAAAVREAARTRST